MFDNIQRLKTGVPGLDEILRGGFPDHSINIITGRPGVGKTILTHQITFANLQEGQKALYLTTLSEPTLKMIRYMREFEFADQSKMGESLKYVDIGDIIQDKGLDGASARILELVKEHEPTIVAIDSFKAIHELSANSVEARKFGFSLSANLTTWGVTAFLIGEYRDSDEMSDDEPIFAIADSIVGLHSEQLGLHSHRFIHVSKMRGTGFFAGRHPYTISSEGIQVFPRIRTPEVVPEYEHKTGRLESGIAELDDMLGGGIPLGSATMIAGGAGTGKTLLGVHFVTTAAEKGDASVIVGFQENPAQMEAITGHYGWNLNQMKDQKLVSHLYHSPVELQPDIHFHRVREAVERVDAKVVLIDSLKDVEIATPDKIRYKDYVYSLVNEFRMRGITTLMTNEIPELFGPFQLSEFGVSFMADNVILLRYVELAGRMGRAINVMKVRGSGHSKDFREFDITDDGARVLEPIRAFAGILTGTPSVSESAAMMNLPNRARFVVESLRQSGPQGCSTIGEATGLATELVQSELTWLLENQFVSVLKDNDQELYSANF